MMELLCLGLLGSVALALLDGSATNIDVQLAVVVEPPAVGEEVVDDPL